MQATWGPKQERVNVLEKAKRVVCWFSCGAASAVAAKLISAEIIKNIAALEKHP